MSLSLGQYLDFQYIYIYIYICCCYQMRPMSVQKPLTMDHTSFFLSKTIFHVLLLNPYATCESTYSINPVVEKVQSYIYTWMEDTH